MQLHNCASACYARQNWLGLYDLLKTAGPAPASHLSAQIQHKKSVHLAEIGSVQTSFAESAKEGVEQGKGQWPRRRAPTVELLAVAMQLCLAIKIFAKCGRRSHKIPEGTQLCSKCLTTDTDVGTVAVQNRCGSKLA